jgi:O-antigen/teichoic acid export membrane protein
MQVAVRVINLAMGVVVTALVARTLGRAGYGQWSTNFVVLTLVGYFMTFGTESVVVREAARDPEHELEWLGADTMLRLISLGPVMLASAAAIVLLHRSDEMLIAGLILVLTMPFGGVGALQLLFRLRVNNRVPMLVLTVRSVLWGVAVIFIYLNNGGMIELALAMAVTNAVGTLVQTVAALRLVGRWPRPQSKRLRALVREAIPVGLAWTLVIAYARIDQVLVFVIAGSKEAGLYGSARNILDQSSFVPVSIMTTLAPVIAASWPANRERLFRTSRLTAELMAIGSLGALAFACVASEEIVRLIYGAPFVPGASALPVFGAAFVFICFNYLNSNLLITFGMQNRLALVSLIALVVNLIGNFILIPLIGFMGAAWMTLVTEIVVFVVSGAIVVRKLEVPIPAPGRITRTLLAAVLLGGALAALKAAGQPLVVLIFAACVTYPALLFGLRAISVADVRVILGRGQAV